MCCFVCINSKVPLRLYSIVWLSCQQPVCQLKRTCLLWKDMGPSSCTITVNWSFAIDFNGVPQNQVLSLIKAHWNQWESLYWLQWWLDQALKHRGRHRGIKCLTWWSLTVAFFQADYTNGIYAVSCISFFPSGVPLSPVMCCVFVCLFVCFFACAHYYIFPLSTRWVGGIQVGLLFGDLN